MALQRVWLGSGDDLNSATSNPNLVFNTATNTLSTGSPLYLPAYMERENVTDETGVFVIGGTTLFGPPDQEGFFTLPNDGKFMGAGYGFNPSTLPPSAQFAVEVINTTTPGAELYTINVGTGQPQFGTFNFTSPLVFNAGDKLHIEWSSTGFGPTPISYQSFNFLFQVILT